MKKDYEVFKVLGLAEKASKAIRLQSLLEEKASDASQLVKELKVVDTKLAKMASDQGWACKRGAWRAQLLAERLIDEIFELDEELAEILFDYLQGTLE